MLTAGESRDKLRPGRDAELGKQPILVRSDRPMPQIQPLRDLAIGQASAAMFWLVPSALFAATPTRTRS